MYPAVDNFNALFGVVFVTFGGRVRVTIGIKKGIKFGSGPESGRKVGVEPKLG